MNSTVSPNRRRSVWTPRMLPDWLVALGGGLAVFAAVGSLTRPLGDDQGFFMWVGRVILDGGVPYRDAFELKGPVAYYLYALVLKIFGVHEYSIRIVDLIATAASCQLLRGVILELNGKDRFGANLGVVFFALAYYGWWISTTAQPDGWAGMLMLIVVAMLLNPPWGEYWTVVAVGGIIAFASLLKPLYVIYLVMPLAYLAGVSIPTITRVRALLLCLAAFVAVITTSMSLLFWESADFESYFDVLYFLYSSYLPERHLSTEVDAFVVAIASLGLLAAFLLAPIGIWLMHRGAQTRQAVILATWLTVGTVSVIAQGRYWPYHWTPAVIALATILGVTVTLIERHLATGDAVGQRYRFVALVVCLTTLLQLANYALSESFQWPGYVLGMTSREQYVRHLTEPWHYWALKNVSDYIRTHSGPNDAVLIWGWDPLLYVLSDRRSATRFGYSLPLIAEGPLRRKYRQNFLEEISKRPPRYIVVDAQKSWALLDKSGLELLNEFPEFSRVVHISYKYLGSVDDFQIWAARR